MITNLKKQKHKTDFKFILSVIGIFLFALWLCTPPGNKAAQICFYGNHTQFFIAKLTKSKDELNEWKFHRNNAIYLARMEDKNASIRSINQAIKTLPSYASNKEISDLYSDRAQLLLYFGDKKGALDDLLKIEKPNMFDMLKIAMLYKHIGKFKYAASYCNTILNMNNEAYIGYACLANVYAAAGRPDVSAKIYNLLIDKSPKNPRYYAERAEYKRMYGDEDGYAQDLKLSKDLGGVLNATFNIIKEAENPSKLTLTIMQ